MSRYGTAVKTVPQGYAEPTSAIILSLPTAAGAVGRVAASRSLAKRTFDAVAALVLLILLLPVIAAIALAVRVTSPGPIFFRQSRTGMNGRIFLVWKFRTMSVLENGDGIRHATRGDARVTPIGARLRSTSLDELPQLLNVLAGDMSLVGPRPHAVAHDRRYGLLIGEYTRRFRVKPGITGLAQVRGLRGEIHDLSCMVARVRADCEYIERWSLFLDLAILLQTIPRLVRDRNAY